MSSNATNSTNTTHMDSDGYKKPAIIYVYISTEICLAVVGTLLNLWFLVAIMTSREMRSRLRMKIICNILVVHLLDCALIIPTNVAHVLTEWSLGCTFYSVTLNLNLIQDFIVNWLVVILLAIYIAQIQDFNPRTKLTPPAATMGTVGLMVLPWAASIIVVPIIVHDSNYRRQSGMDACFYPSEDAYQVFKSIDTAVPILLAVLLLIVAAALRHRRFTPDYYSGSMRAELINSGPEIDSTFVYVAVVAICIFCDLPRLIMSFDIYIFEIFSILWVNLYVTAMMLGDARVILMTLPWLLFPDVRQRVKTWRPWNRSSPGVDLTVAYKKEES